MKSDIKTESDVELMVNTFYHNLLEHAEIKPFFENVNLEEHMPHMIAFWQFVLLDKEGYKTNVFDKHVHMKLSPVHFSIWLKEFENTVLNLFEGEKAQMAITRAQTIGYTFQNKLSQMGKLGDQS